MVFRNRADAGCRLATALSDLWGRTDVIVLGLPRGGLPVANEIALQLRAPLDVFLVRKLGVPGHPELALGAIAEGGVRVLNHSIVRDLGISAPTIEAIATSERAELERREQAYRDGRPSPEVRGRIVILVDDGLATGATMEAAAVALRQRGPSRLIIAVPVGAQETCARLRSIADQVLCLATPEPFDAVGLWYADFSQTSDDEVRALLSVAGARQTAVQSAPSADRDGQPR